MEIRMPGDNRKVFFLHPHAVVQDELAYALITENIEAYLLRNHVSAKIVLREYPDAVFLMQVDSGLDEDKWIEYAEDLKSFSVFSDLTICVLSVSGMEEIKKTYLQKSRAFSYGVTYGRYEFAKTYKIIRDILEREKVNPPGFAVKGTSPERLTVTVDFTRDHKRYEGVLKTVSLSGLTCKIESTEPLYASEIPVSPISISYGNTQFLVSGRIVGNSDDDESIYLILFDDTVGVEKRDEIYVLIQTCLQSQIEAKIAEKSRKNRLSATATRSQLYRK